MTELSEQPRQWTFDELTGKMAQEIHAFVYNNGPDLEDHDLAIPCDDLPLDIRRARWAEARKQKRASQPAPVVHRRYPSTNAHAPSFILPAPQPEADEEGKGTSRKAVVAKFIQSNPDLARDDLAEAMPNIAKAFGKAQPAVRPTWPDG